MEQNVTILLFLPGESFVGHGFSHLSVSTDFCVLPSAKLVGRDGREDSRVAFRENISSSIASVVFSYVSKMMPMMGKGILSWILFLDRDERSSVFTMDGV